VRNKFVAVSYIHKQTKAQPSPNWGVDTHLSPYTTPVDRRAFHIEIKQ